MNKITFIGMAGCGKSTLGRALSNKIGIECIDTDVLIEQKFNQSLEELKKAYETKDINVIDPALEKINEAWKVASEEMYKAQQDAQGTPPQDAQGESASKEDDVEDVDFEEVEE